MRELRCEEARSRLVEMADQLAEASLARHVERCEACSGEFAALRSDLATLRALDPLADSPPGDYWDRFLPSVHARIRTPGSRPRILPGEGLPAGRGPVRARRAFLAASLLMAGAAALALLLVGRAALPPAPDSAERRLESLLASFPGSPADLERAFSGVWGGEAAPAWPEESSTVEPADLLDALDGLADPARPLAAEGLWNDRMEHLLDRLDAASAAALRDALAEDES